MTQEQIKKFKISKNTSCPNTSQESTSKKTVESMIQDNLWALDVASSDSSVEYSEDRICPKTIETEVSLG